MPLSLSKNKNNITAALLALSLILLGVFLSAKIREEPFKKDQYHADKKIQHQMSIYLVKRHLIGSKEFCTNYPGTNVFQQSAKNCTLGLLGQPDKIIGNKFSYELLSDQIILWRKYLIIEFNQDKDEVVSAGIQHFDI